MVWRWVGPSPGMKDRTPEVDLSRGSREVPSPARWRCPPCVQLLAPAAQAGCREVQPQPPGLGLAAAPKNLLRSSSETRQGWKKGRDSRRKKQKYLGQKGSKRILGYRGLPLNTDVRVIVHCTIFDNIKTSLLISSHEKIN